MTPSLPWLSHLHSFAPSPSVLSSHPLFSSRLLISDHMIALLSDGTQGMSHVLDTKMIAHSSSHTNMLKRIVPLMEFSF